MSARFPDRLIAKPASLSPESWTSKRPRSPLTVNGGYEDTLALRVAAAG
jgi:hypothetical protein